jgi:hypothetical protein
MAMIKDISTRFDPAMSLKARKSVSRLPIPDN